MNPATVIEVEGWQASLQLGFVRRGDKTVLSRRQHRGPLTVQRPFYPEGGICHVYLLHPPGGVVAGDCLAIDIGLAEGAEALLTTPAAGKFYRSSGKQAVQKVSMQIDAGAVMEWLPQETIVYEGARLSSITEIELFDDARFLGWEILALGRPAAGEGFSVGEAELNWRISRNNKPLLMEKLHLDAKAFNARWGLQGRSCCGTLFATSASKQSLEIVRELIGESPGKGVTLIDDLLICRASADQAETVRRFFEQARAMIRHDIMRRETYAPRIWAT
jgi:urease accessory protein